MLHRALHTAEGQFERQGIVVNFDSMLACAIFAGKQLHPCGRRCAVQRPLRQAALRAATARSRRGGRGRQ
eukprot:5316347-Pyramimonas_sp.AAC.2